MLSRKSLTLLLESRNDVINAENDKKISIGLHYRTYEKWKRSVGTIIYIIGALIGEDPAVVGSVTSGQVWAAAATVVVTCITTIGAVSIAHIKTRNTQEDTQARVEAVRELTQPIGNGFTRDVRDALATLNEGMARIERRQEKDAEATFRFSSIFAQHLADHARAEVLRHAGD